jgi:hypothetical protein
MQHWVVASLYLIIGLVCAGFVYFPSPERSARLVGSALLTVVLWPLWAPFALAPAALTRGPLSSRIALALDHAGITDPVLGRSETAHLLRQVDAAERRLTELDAQLGAMHGEDPGLERACPDARARAQLWAASRSQLEALRDRERGALLELAELCELLRAQHLLSRFGGCARAGELRDELWLRIQVLSEIGEPYVTEIRE